MVQIIHIIIYITLSKALLVRSQSISDALEKLQFQNTQNFPFLESQGDVIYLVSDSNAEQWKIEIANSIASYKLIGGKIALVGIGSPESNASAKFLYDDDSTPLSIFVFTNYETTLNNWGLLSSPLKTWIFQSGNYLPANLSILQPHLTSNIYYFDLNSMLHEIYGIKGHHVRDQIAGEHSLPKLSSLARRLDLNGAQLEVAHVHKPPIFTRRGIETETGANWGADLISYQMLAYMQDLLNFTIQFHDTNTWVYAIGSPSDGQIYGGMALMLVTGEADLALSNTGLWSNRDFSFLFVTRVYKEINVYYHTAYESSSGKNIYSEVFPIPVLIILFILVLAVFVLSAIFFTEEGMQDLTLWVVSTFAQQGPIEPKSRYQVSGRILIVTVLIFCLIFYSSISAFLLAKFSFYEEIKGINGLIQRGYKFGILKDSILHNGFKFGFVKPSSPVWPIQNLYKTFLNESDGAVEVVNSKQFAFISGQNFFLSYLPTLLKLDICGNMKQMIIPSEKRWGSAFLKPQSEFRNHFNFARLHMFQFGFTTRFLKEVDRKIEDAKPSCYSASSNNVDSYRGIYFQEIELLFYILCFGIVLSIAVIAIEILYMRLIKQRTLRDLVD